MASGWRAHSPKLSGFTGALRGAGVAFERDAANITKAEGDKIVDDAKSKADSLGAQLGRAGDNFKDAADGEHLKITVENTRSVPFAIGAVMGAAHDVPREVTRGGTTFAMAGWNQFLESVGDSWEVGGPGGPRAINESIGEHADALLNKHADALTGIWDAA